MIFQGPLSVARQHRSQKFYYIFNLINGLSYMCLGETVIILLAVKIKSPDAIVAVLGSMSFFGYLMLPLGKKLTSHVGAVKTQAICWVLRNVSALIVASSAIFYWLDLTVPAICLLLGGAWLFYGFRSAGVVMSQPLVGDIAAEKERGRVLAISNALFFGSCLLALSGITLLLQQDQSIRMLVGVIAFGATCGIFASAVFYRVDETAALRDSARKTLGRDFRYAIHSPSLQKQIFAVFFVNLGTILLLPISILALKRGYALTDFEILKFALLQFGTSSLMSLLTGRLSLHIAPEKILFGAYVALLMPVLFWLFAPKQYVFWYFAPLWGIAGAATVSATNAATHYFLQSVPVAKRIAVSIFLSIFTGAGAGIAGMAVGSGLLKLCASFAGSSEPLTQYRWYFLLAGMLLFPGIILISRLPHFQSRV